MRDGNDTRPGEDSASAVDSLSLTEVKITEANTDPEFDAVWNVSDPDGNLASVTLILVDDTDGEVEGTKTIGVNGTTASGITRLNVPDDHGFGNHYIVGLTVTDSSGATGTDTASATESEPTDDSGFDGGDGRTDDSGSDDANDDDAGGIDGGGTDDGDRGINNGSTDRGTAPVVVLTAILVTVMMQAMRGCRRCDRRWRRTYADAYGNRVSGGQDQIGTEAPTAELGE